MWKGNTKIFYFCDSALPQLMQPGPTASAGSEHSQHLPLVNTHCELKLHSSQMVSQMLSQFAQYGICALEAAVGKRRGVILGSLNIRAVSALITPAATMLVASGKWTNPSVSSDICGVAGQDDYIGSSCQLDYSQANVPTVIVYHELLCLIMSIMSQENIPETQKKQLLVHGPFTAGAVQRARWPVCYVAGCFLLKMSCGGLFEPQVLMQTLALI